MPINLPNGNDVEEIVLPNGANASEVYGPNGKLVWEGTAIPDSGTSLYIMGHDNDAVFKYSLSTAFDLSAASLSTSFDVRANNSDPRGLIWNDDGTKFYNSDFSNAELLEYQTSEAFDLGGASFNAAIDVSSNDSKPLGIAWNADGSKLYFTGNGGENVYEYDCSTKFDITSATFSQSFDVSTEEGTPTDVTWNVTGDRFYIIGFGSADVHQYNLSTAFDISTAFYSGTSLSVSEETLYAYGMGWNADGTKMYVLSNTNNSIYEYALSTGFDLSTASYSGNSLDVSTEDGEIYGMSWNGAPQYSTW